MSATVPPVFARRCCELLLALLFGCGLATGAVAQADNSFIDVSISLFSSTAPPPTAPAAAVDTTAPATPDTDAQVRLAEMRYLPMYLRYRLEQTQLFGAVRVVPEADKGAQLMVEGNILGSDGSVLEMSIKAHDSTGRVWIDKTYKGMAVDSVSLNADPLAQDDFAALFGQVVRDLTGVLEQLDPAELTKIHSVALLRYGLSLVPKAFEDYLQDNPDGTVTVKRLPAANDPILQRIQAIREHDYLFVDVVDQEYQQFYSNIKPVYDMWRQVQREQVQSASSFEARETNAPSQYRRGSYYALQESYNNYRWAKLQGLYLNELSEGFANEVEPTQIALKDSLYKLTGTREQQYREWRGILAELFALDTQ